MRMIIAVAAHKPAWLPCDAPYLPVEAGAALRSAHLTDAAGKPLTRDDAGDNISGKNPTFCELTALYRLWKGFDAEYLGLCHYRRFFAGKRFGPRKERLLTEEQALKLMEGIDCLVPKKRHYFIQSGYDQYTHAHHEQDLLATRQVLSELPDPRYTEAFDRTLRRTSGHRFNLLLMRREVFDEYCDWLFTVLFRVEARLDISGYSAADRRVFGYLAERLLDVWLEVRKPRIRECPVVNLESQHWPRKILRFLLRMIHPVNAPKSE